MTEYFVLTLVLVSSALAVLSVFLASPGRSFIRDEVHRMDREVAKPGVWIAGERYNIVHRAHDD